MLIEAMAHAASSATMPCFDSPRRLRRKGFHLYTFITVTKAVNNSQKGASALGKFRASVFLSYVHIGGCIYTYGCVFVFGGTARSLHTGSKQQDNAVIEASFCILGVKL